MVIDNRYRTKRAPDAGDSAASSSSFLRLSIFLVGRLRPPRPSAGSADRYKTNGFPSVMPQDTTLRQVASAYADTIIRAVKQEYPNSMQHVITGPNDRPTPRELHPAFYGCFDWHSSVHMHWVLIRLLRLVPEHLDQLAVLAVLESHLTESALLQEAKYLLARRSFERPYGWGWALTLAHELTIWEHELAEKYLTALRPLAEAITELFLEWLPKATYPVRVGMHSNSAFGLARSVPWARYLAKHGDDRLLNTITQTAIKWYGEDQDYPARYEPSGYDFLSPALTEVELMSAILDQKTFIQWLDAFLPELSSGNPRSLFEPAHVSDARDGQLAHLHGLNLYRAFVWKLLRDKLHPNDIRKEVLQDGIDTHVNASMGAVTGSDYMVEHWLASYAILYLSGG